MKKRQIKYIFAQNFLCFGDEPVEIDFMKLGKIVHVRGINQDTGGDNGAGKSSLQEIPVYAFFGKTIKRQRKRGHSNIVHNKATNKELRVEVRIDDYRVVRTRKGGGGTGTLQVWKSSDGIWNKDTEVTRGGMPATEVYIEKEVLGLNYETFLSVYIFQDDNVGSFLECDKDDRQKIVENLLSLERYNTYHKVANDHLKEAKNLAKEALKEYEAQQQEIDANKIRIKRLEEKEERWKADKQKECTGLLAKINTLNSRLTNSGIGKALIEYQEAQVEIAELNAKVPGLQKTSEEFNKLLAGMMPKYEEINKKISELHTGISTLDSKLAFFDAQIKGKTDEIDAILGNVGQLCPFCKRGIDESHSDSVIEGMRKKIEGIKSERKIHSDERTALQLKLDEQSVLYKNYESNLTLGRKKVQGIEAQISSITAGISRLGKIENPQADADQLGIQKELESEKERLKNKEKEVSPHQSTMIEYMEELVVREAAHQEKCRQYKEKEKDIPHLDYWEKAFGDKGIRKCVIDGIVPDLNKRIVYWLQLLGDNKIKLELDNELSPSVDIYPFDGSEFIYDILSKGQRRRLILALTHSFAHVMTHNCGSCPSTLFLDEVSTNMDEPGVEDIYKVIHELAKERQVFVIDHNKVLLQKLAGCDTITLEMKNGITRMLK